MEWKTISTDLLERRLVDDERLIDRIRARQLMVLEELDRRQVATGDGCRSLSEWVAASLDVGSEVARSLVQTMRRTADRRDLREALAVGEAGFARVEALSWIPEDLGLLPHLDIGGVRGEAAKRAHISAEDEYRTADDRFLVIQPSLDESWWKLWGGLDGASGALVDKVLTEAADSLPTFPDGTRGDRSWRKATALVGLCLSDDPPPANVAIIVDAAAAADTSGQTGVILEAGPRVAAQALQAVLCDAATEVIARAEDGRYLDYGRKTRTVPPTLKRALLHKYGNRCAADGCQSNYRLEAHHRTPWAEGGNTNQQDLILLCWFHHQIVVHQRGYHIYQHPDHGRIRFKPPPQPARSP